MKNLKRKTIEREKIGPPAAFPDKKKYNPGEIKLVMKQTGNKTNLI
jgi:hypothetical protein